jgi:flagellar hook-basal body complex protein FliE
MAIAAIGAVSGAMPALPTQPTQTAGAGGTTGAAGTGFNNAFTDALANVNQKQGVADNLAVQSATGQLTDVHDYMIASTQAQLATELTVAVRNKAVESFNEIMRMQF